jgi:hypothetical protein
MSTHPTRRAVLLGAGLTLATGLAGCLDRPLASFSASPATVDGGALDRDGYEDVGVTEQVLTQGFGPARRAVEVRNWVARYVRPLDPSVLPDTGGTNTDEASPGPLAPFAVLSTPRVELGGQSFNPVGGFSANDVATRVQGLYGELREFERVGERSVSALGRTVRVVEYRAAGDLEGLGFENTSEPASTAFEGIDLSVHVSDPVAHEDDFVLAVAAGPRDAAVGAGAVDRLLGAVVHPDDAARTTDT